MGQAAMSPQLDLIRLIDDTQKYAILNKELYSQTAAKVIEGLYQILFKSRQPVTGINHRLKSPESLKEKLIRKKLYKGCTQPEQVLARMSDIIGIMIECEFIRDERTIFECIAQHFTRTQDQVFYQCDELPDVYVNLGTVQPVRQKNGNELYKLDCYYQSGPSRINFELQIKSLVNSFWCEVEHNIVYKNNHYLDSDDYVSSMLSAVRINLMGLDEILQLINSRINALNAYNVVRDLELNENLVKQLVSDLINAKMVESVGFTVESKKIRDLLSWYILRREGARPEAERKDAFYALSGRFRSLHGARISFDRKISVRGRFHAADQFSQIVGGKLITLMNTDFEWHAFFVMLFAVYSQRGPEECFRDFVGTVRALLCESAAFAALSGRLPAEDAQTVREEAQMFLAEALCETGNAGILAVEDYRRRLADVNGLMQYTLNCLDDMEEWVSKRSALQAVIQKSLHVIGKQG